MKRFEGMTGRVEGKWLLFQEEEPKPKTKVWSVYSKSTRTLLGQIFYHAPWRNYVFGPVARIIFDKNCMQEITDFIAKANAEQRRKD
jgi:hypothetical protein